MNDKTSGSLGAERADPTDARGLDGIRALKVGDRVWVAGWIPRHVERLCPVCFGKCFVAVILGDGTRVETPCNYCGVGFDRPRGFTMDYDYGPNAIQRTVTEVRTRQDTDGVSFDYLMDGCYCPEPCDVFADRESAMVRAAERAEQAAREEDARLRAKKDGTLKKASWLVGYHRREAKEARRMLAYHEARARPPAAATRVGTADAPGAPGAEASEGKEHLDDGQGWREVDR